MVGIFQKHVCVVNGGGNAVSTLFLVPKFQNGENLNSEAK